MYGLVCVVLLLLFALLGDVYAEVQHVIVISIDGGRGDFIKTFIETAPGEFPNFQRLRDASGHTFNARCDYSISLTIPDHLCMLTGRPALTFPGLPNGVQHGYSSDFPQASDTVHNSGDNPTVYKSSIFDVVHDHGASTALYLGKTRLQICNRSWDAVNGAPDLIGPDNGRDKIDLGVVTEAGGGSTNTAAMVNTFVETIRNGTIKNFTLFHIADTDYAGHSGTWTTGSGSMYRTVMRVADGWIGQILDAIQGNAALNGKVAVILTADHGGGTPPNNHSDPANAMNYTIPFFLLAPGINGGSNLYEYLENRFDPGTSRPSYADTRQPMRNGDVANLAAALLGLPSVPGALMIPEFKKPLLIDRNETTGTVSWPSYLTGYKLESTNDLSAPEWVPVSSGIVERNGQKAYTFALPTEGTRFFRLRQPVESEFALSRPPSDAETVSVVSQQEGGSVLEVSRKVQKRTRKRSFRK